MMFQFVLVAKVPACYNVVLLSATYCKRISNSNHPHECSSVKQHKIIFANIYHRELFQRSTPAMNCRSRGELTIAYLGLDHKRAIQSHAVNDTVNIDRVVFTKLIHQRVNSNVRPSPTHTSADTAHTQMVYIHTHKVLQHLHSIKKYKYTQITKIYCRLSCTIVASIAIKEYRIVLHWSQFEVRTGRSILNDTILHARAAKCSAKNRSLPDKVMKLLNLETAPPAQCSHWAKCITISCIQTVLTSHADGGLV